MYLISLFQIYVPESSECRMGMGYAVRQVQGKETCYIEHVL